MFQGYLLSQLVCVVATGLNILYLEVITQFEFHGLGINYFLGQERNGTYRNNTAWIDQVVPRKVVAFFKIRLFASLDFCFLLNELY